MLTVIACAVVVGLCLGALGGGGSILTVPVLVTLLHVAPQSATGASLIIVGSTSIIAAIAHARGGRVRWRAAVAFGVIGSIAAFGASKLNREVDPQVLLIAFSAIMLVAAAMMLRLSWKPRDGDFRPNEPVRQGSPIGAASSSVTALTEVRPVVRPLRARATQAGKFVGPAVAVGAMTGFLGVGGGFFIVPALVVALGYAMPVAVGTSLVIIAINSAAAFAERAGSGSVPWDIVAPFTVAAIAASFVGTLVSHRISGPALTRGFAALVVVIAVYVGTDAVLALAR